MCCNMAGNFNHVQEKITKTMTPYISVLVLPNVLHIFPCSHIWDTLGYDLSILDKAVHFQLFMKKNVNTVPGLAFPQPETECHSSRLYKIKTSQNSRKLFRLNGALTKAIFFLNVVSHFQKDISSSWGGLLYS